MKSIFQEAARVHLNEILLLLCALDRQLINSSRMKRLRKSYHRFLQDCEKKKKFSNQHQSEFVGTWNVHGRGHTFAVSNIKINSGKPTPGYQQSALTILHVSVERAEF